MDKYSILERIGDGSQGVAYIATVKGGTPPQKVVLKKMPQGIRSSEEINVALRMHHPNIVETIEAFDHEDFTYLVMRHAEGGDLDAYLARRAASSDGPLPVGQVVLWMYQLCRALQHCHDNRIMHRDIKPSNLFLSSDGSQVLLGDFGTAKAFSGSVAVANTFVGSPVWVSPEVLSGTPYSFMSDVWSLGCVFYEMIALRKAFGAPHFAALVTKICSGTYDPLPPKVPPFLANVIQGMLNVDANERWLLSDILNSHEQFQLAAVATRKQVAQGRRATGGGSSNTAATVENRAKPTGQQNRDRAAASSEAVLAPLDDWVKSKQRDLLRIEAYLRPFRDNDALILRNIAQRTPVKAEPTARVPLDALLAVRDDRQDGALKANRAKRMLASPARKEPNPLPVADPGRNGDRSSTPQTLAEVPKEREERPAAGQRRSLSEELQHVAKRPVPPPPPQQHQQPQGGGARPQAVPLSAESPKDMAARERDAQEQKRVQTRLDMKAMIKEARARKSEHGEVPVEIVLPSNLQGLPQNRM